MEALLEPLLQDPPVGAISRGSGGDAGAGVGHTQGAKGVIESVFQVMNLSKSAAGSVPSPDTTPDATNGSSGGKGQEKSPSVEGDADSGEVKPNRPFKRPEIDF